MERLIREAQSAGKFRDLKGQGAPQDLRENPFEDPEMRLAYKVLSNAGYCPPWMELSKEISADVAAAERVWEDYRHHRRRQLTAVRRSSTADFAGIVREIDSSREQALTRLDRHWQEINRKIAHLNATVPAETLRRAPLQRTQLQAKFAREFPLLAGVMER